MPRWLRIVLTILAVAFGGYIGLLVVGGGAAGIAWLYLFGDDPWPRWSEFVLPLVALAGSLAGAFALGLATWRSTGNYRS